MSLTDPTPAAPTALAMYVAEAARAAGYDIDSRRGDRAALAHAAGMHPSSIGRILAGKTGVAAEALPGLAKALARPVEELLRVCGILPAAPAVGLPLPADVRDLLAAVLDALDVPSPANYLTDERAYLRLLEQRASTVRCSLLGLLAEDEPNMRFDAAWIRAGSGRTPVTYATAEQSAAPVPAACGDAACLLPGAHSHHVPRLAVTRTPAAPEVTS